MYCEPNIRLGADEPVVEHLPVNIIHRFGMGACFPMCSASNIAETSEFMQIALSGFDTPRFADNIDDTPNYSHCNRKAMHTPDEVYNIIPDGVLQTAKPTDSSSTFFYDGDTTHVLAFNFVAVFLLLCLYASVCVRF